jgi:hypothetical protein
MIFQNIVINNQKPCIDITKDVLISPSPFAKKEEWETYHKRIEELFPKVKEEVKEKIEEPKSEEKEVKNEKTV